MTTVALSDFCDFSQGGKQGLSGKHFVDSGYPAYGAGGLNGYLPESEFHRDAVVLSAIGARCGKCFLATGEWASLANTQLIFPDPARADVRFLWYQLNDEGRWPRHGVAQPFIRPSDVKSHLVALPPLDEQRRIAAILDKADAVRQKRKRAIALLDSLTQSIFDEYFGDTLVNDRAWPSGPVLSDVADVGSGITKGRPERGAPTSPVPYLAVLNVQDKRLDLSQVKQIEATEAEVARYRLLPGDLLLTEGGDPDKLGRGTLWRGELPVAIHQNHVFRVRFGEAVAPLFANWLIGGARGKAYFLRAAKQTTGIASINKTQLSSFPMLLPPMSVQLAFQRAAEAVERQRRLVEAAASAEAALFFSFQHRAFSGQL